MYFVNEFDVNQIAMAALKHQNERPNTHKGAQALFRLMGWVNANSDGWVYWPKPMRAAAKLSKLLEERTIGHYGHTVQADISDRELTLAISPIKAFLTRQGVNHSEVL